MRICLVGVTHPCHNPRLVREADTLAAAGHDVRVVAPSFMPDLAEKDRRLMRSRSWRLDVYDMATNSASARVRSALARGSRRLATRRFTARSTSGSAEGALALAHGPLRRLASREQSDWYIAHAQGALPIAAAAAQRWSARLAFDCEDLLSIGDDPAAAAARVVEERYLPGCDYVSVTSRGMAAHLTRAYGVQDPLVLYNVFPLRLAHDLTRPDVRPSSPTLRLHWFSQTVGPERGLEDALQALSRLPDHVQLHLRGVWSPGYRPQFEAEAQRLGVKERVVYHPTIDHDDLIHSMGGFDVGLALERPANSNYATTVTNKIFSYLLAGLAVATTDAPGQAEVMRRVPEAGFLYPAGDWAELATRLQHWVSNRNDLLAAQCTAWDAARETFCWDREEPSFLHRLEQPVAVSRPASARALR